MSSLSEYQLLINDGTFNDRVKFILLLKDRSQIEEYLRNSLDKSYDHLQIFVFLSNLTKNQKNLLKIFQNESLPIGQRILAAKYWIRLQNDSKIVQNFVVETINNKDHPPLLKHRILKHLRQYPYLRKSSSFFYDLCCELTSNDNHEIDANLLPYCNRDQINDLLSRWSIKCLKQFDLYSPFILKLCEYHPSILIQLMKEDLRRIDGIDEKYFDDKTNLIELICKKETKELICLFISHLNQLENDQRYFPLIISKQMKYFFYKCPNEMIDLITLVASNRIGSLKYRTQWGSSSNLSSFSFPRSFSSQNFIRLFDILYEKCRWCDNHLNELIQLMLIPSHVSQQRKYYFDEILQKKMKFEQGNDQTLSLLSQYPKLTNELSIYLLKKKEKENGFIKAEERLTFLRYQLMNKDLFDQFLLLFKETGSNVDQRQLNYPLFIQSAISTNDHLLTQNVLQFIEKRFVNEQLIVIEAFLRKLPSFDRHFHLEILPNNVQSIETIFDISINHLQRTSSTLSYIINYSIDLLQFIENKPNQSIETFAIQSIRKSFEKDEDVICSIPTVSSCYPRCRQILLNIFLKEVFPKLVSKGRLDQILSSYTNQRKIPKELDSFLEEFFRQSLFSLKKFRLEDHSIMIRLFLRNHSTRSQRVHFLINQINEIFFMNENIQRMAVHSQQHRSLLDRLFEDNQILTIDKFSNEQNSFPIETNSSTDTVKLPGLYLDVLSTSIRFLTGKQQEHITQIIIEHFIPNDEVNNREKLRSLRILRRLRHTYPRTLQWIKEKQELLVEKVGGRANRGAAGQPIDDIIICLPATCDLTKEIFFEQFQILKTKINPTNAKFISDAMRNLSQRLNNQLFLTNYFQFIENEHFLKLGVTANKEILRLSIDYPGIMKDLIEPFWDKNVHDDIRACLVLIVLHSIEKCHSNEVWNLLQQSTKEEYLLIIQYLFGSNSNSSRRILSKLKYSFPHLFDKYVNEIQFLVLDHPKSLEIRSIAWREIDHEFVQFDLFIKKSEDLILQFNKDGNHLWELAFNKLISLFKQQKISSVQKLVEIIEKLMSRRDEIDSKENGIDSEHDLPVYHRIQRLLNNLYSHIHLFNQFKLDQFRLLFQKIILFDPTFAPIIAKLILRISTNKEQIEEFFLFLETNLSKNYFQRLLSQFGNSSPFIEQLNIEQKMEFVQWFIQKNRTLFIWDFLKEQIFSQTNIDRQFRLNLIQQIRSTDDLFLRQQSMEYVVPWDQQ